jgi:hypothetical protein
MIPELHEIETEINTLQQCYNTLSDPSIIVQLRCLRENITLEDYPVLPILKYEDQGDFDILGIRARFGERTVRGHAQAVILWKLGQRSRRPSSDWLPFVYWHKGCINHDSLLLKFSKELAIARGQVFGNLTVIGEAYCCAAFDYFLQGPGPDGDDLSLEYLAKGISFDVEDVAFVCLCSCGKEKCVRGVDLLSGVKKSCLGKNQHGWREAKAAKKLEIQQMLVVKAESKAAMKLLTGDITKSYWNSILAGAKPRELPVTITPEYVWSVWLAQKGCCALTGKKLSFKKKDAVPPFASLDRKDSAKGYVEGNVQWVKRRINLMKSNSSDVDFIEECRQVADYNKK